VEEATGASGIFVISCNHLNKLNPMYANKISNRNDINS